MAAGVDMLVVALYAAPLMVAAAWDSLTFRIPNSLNLVFLVLFVPAAMLAPQAIAWHWHIAAFAVMLAGGFVLFALRWFGGGDVKLLAVASLWLGWDRLLEFVVWVGIFGGVLAIALILLRTQPMQMLYVHLGRTPRLLQPKGEVPYGIAIAAGGLMMAARLPMVTG